MRKVEFRCLISAWWVHMHLMPCKCWEMRQHLMNVAFLVLSNTVLGTLIIARG